MNFDLSDEQRMLGDMVSRFVTERYDFLARNAYMREPDGFSRAVWNEMAGLGLLALPFGEQDGGLGGGGIETMLVMQAFGRGLVLEPYLATIVICGTSLARAGTVAQRAERVAGIVAGTHLMAFAHHEPHRSFSRSGGLRTAATRNGTGWRLSGTKTAVTDGHCAAEFIVSAETPDGPSLFLVESGAVGATIRAKRGYDGHGSAELVLDGVRVEEAARLPGEGALSAVLETAIAALCAEAVGVMETVFETTIEYLKTRRQFGVAIGSFQALQHRAVEMLIQLELARSMAMLAALSLQECDPDQRARNIAAAKAQIGISGRFIGQQAVQMHGAIGITAEYKVGHAFKRLTAIDALFGDANQQLDFLAEQGGLHAA